MGDWIGFDGYLFWVGVGWLVFRKCFGGIGLVMVGCLMGVGNFVCCDVV